MMPKVSICIPAYNQAGHLKRTIDSVLWQTYTDYEIIITDDSPSGVVADLVTQYNLPEKIKYFKNPSRLGSPENWNESIRNASGEYIKILHHDDWLNFKDSLEKYVHMLDQNPGADLAFSATQAIYPKGNGWVHKISQAQVTALSADPLMLYSNNIIGAPSTTIIRNNRCLRFDPNLKWHVDIEYYIRQISRNAMIIYSQEPLAVTFLAEGRVSDECLGNKEVEIIEYFYLLDKIASNKKNYGIASFKKCILKTIAVCNSFNIFSMQDVRDCGYHGNIHFSIRTWLTLNTVSSTLGKLYLKFLRTMVSRPYPFALQN